MPHTCSLRFERFNLSRRCLNRCMNSIMRYLQVKRTIRRAGLGHELQCRPGQRPNLLGILHRFNRPLAPVVNKSACFVLIGAIAVRIAQGARMASHSPFTEMTCHIVAVDSNERFWDAQKCFVLNMIGIHPHSDHGEPCWRFSKLNAVARRGTNGSGCIGLREYHARIRKVFQIRCFEKVTA